MLGILQDVTDVSESELGEGVLASLDSVSPLEASVSNPLLDSNSLLESVRVQLPQDLWKDQSTAQYASILGVVRDGGKAYSKLPFLAHETESDEDLLCELYSQQAFVDQPPLERPQKSIPPFESVSMYETGHNSTDFTGNCSPTCAECFNLSDFCETCEENETLRFVSSLSGAPNDLDTAAMTGWSTYQPTVIGTNSGRLRHTEQEILSMIEEVSIHQSHGVLAQVTERFKNLNLREKEFIAFCVDSGATDTICSKLSAFETINRNAPVKCFKVVHGSARIYSAGLGTVLLPVTTVSGRKINLRIHDVYYVPDQPFNLLSVSRLLDCGWKDPTFSKSYWQFQDHQIPMTKHGNYFIESDSADSALGLESEETKQPLPQSRTDAKYHHEKAKAERAKAHRPFREKADWQLRKSLYRELAAELGNAHGDFDVDLFTDGKGPIKGNAQTSQFYSAADDAFSHYWGGRFCYGNPVFEQEFIRRMLEKAEEDFQADPENTRFCFVLPYYKTASWWALTAPYHIQKVISREDNVYTAPRDQCYSVDALTDAGDEGGENRVFINPPNFDTVILYRDRHTPTRVDPYVLTHLRLGHYSPKYIQRLLDLGIDLGVPISGNVLAKHRLSCSCVPCRLAKARRPAFPKTERGRLAGLKPFQKVCFDFTGPIAPTASRDDLRYVLCFTCRKTNFSKVYFCQKRSEFLFKFKEFITWCKTRGFTTDEIKCDGAKEFDDSLVREFCEQEKIVQQFSAPYAHESNGFAERKFQTLADVARALIHTADLDNVYWPYAWEHACLLSNVMPTKSSDDSSFYPPYFKLYGRHFEYKKLRVWGCRAYPFIGNDKVKKLEDRCLDGYRFVGIDERSNAFLLLHPDTGDQMLSGMPTFYENLTEYGKVISDHSIAHRNEFYETEVTTDPGIIALGKKDKPFKGQSIVTHRAYVNTFDKKSREVRAVVRVKCIDSEERWLYLDEFLHANGNVSVRKSNWTLFQKYIENHFRLGHENNFYPLFSAVKASPRSVPQCKKVDSFICAWDRESVSDGRKTPYLVCGAPSSFDPFDASTNEVSFPSAIPHVAASVVSDPDSPEFSDFDSFVLRLKPNLQLRFSCPRTINHQPQRNRLLPCLMHLNGVLQRLSRRLHLSTLAPSNFLSAVSFRLTVTLWLPSPCMISRPRKMAVLTSTSVVLLPKGFHNLRELTLTRLGLP